jgi:hypothetical protein
MTAQEETNGKAGERQRIPVVQAMHRAADQLTELLRRDAASVSAVKATEDGWTADVEVVEIERVPDTTSVMASYRVRLDSTGQLTGYERTRRYSRGHVDR